MAPTRAASCGGRGLSLQERALRRHGFAARDALQENRSRPEGQLVERTVLVYTVRYICKMNLVSADKCVHLNTESIILQAALAAHPPARSEWHFASVTVV